MLNSEAKEELDGFGDHLTVVVESASGVRYEVEEITTASPRGETVVTIVMGELHDSE